MLSIGDGWKASAPVPEVPEVPMIPVMLRQSRSSVSAGLGLWSHSRTKSGGMGGGVVRKSPARKFKGKG